MVPISFRVFVEGGPVYTILGILGFTFTGILAHTGNMMHNASLRARGSALRNIKQLRGMLPICSACKKIRNDEGYWEQLEAYLRDHTEAEFSHSICPDCAKKLYPDIMLDKPVGQPAVPLIEYHEEVADRTGGSGRYNLDQPGTELHCNHVRVSPQVCYSKYICRFQVVSNL